MSTYLKDDDSNHITLPSQPSVPARTTWTLLLYLTSSSEGCIGGETVFYPHDRRSANQEIPVPPETGMLLLHKHGNDCLLVRDSCPSPFTVLSTPTLQCQSTIFIESPEANGLQHEGREVLAGEKWILRTDLCVRR
jgi:hypothetical protein